MNDAKNLYVIINQPIGHNKGCSRNNQFSCPLSASRAPKIRKTLQKIYVGQNPIYKVVC